MRPPWSLRLFALGVRTFADTLFAGEVPGIRAIKAELKVGQPRAQEIQTYLTAGPITRTSSARCRSRRRPPRRRHSRTAPLHPRRQLSLGVRAWAESARRALAGGPADLVELHDDGHPAGDVGLR